jgi:hypothetical protein
MTRLFRTGTHETVLVTFQRHCFTSVYTLVAGGQSEIGPRVIPCERRRKPQGRSTHSDPVFLRKPAHSEPPH